MSVSGNGIDMLLSAKRETPWAKALRLGLTRYGDTPIYDALSQETTDDDDPG